MLKTLLILVIVAYAVLIAYAYFMADRLMFRPPACSYTPTSVPIEMVETEDGERIAVTHLHNPSADLTILYHHGNAEDLGHLYAHLQRIRDAGFSIVAFDYRGYGMSSRGRPTAGGAVLDAEAAYRYTVDVLGVAPSELILLGRSVGSGPATDLASRMVAAGLIIEGGFTSAFRVVTHLPILPFDRFPNVLRISQISVPVLIVHGDQDEVIHVRHGRQLYRAANEPKHMLEVAGGGHSDLMLMAAERYLQSLKDFGDLVRVERDD